MRNNIIKIGSKEITTELDRETIINQTAYAIRCEINRIWENWRDDIVGNSFSNTIKGWIRDEVLDIIRSEFRETARTAIKEQLNNKKVEEILRKMT